MTNYTWAANLTKLRRAEAQCGVGASEEMILEAYRKMGGLVIGNGPMVVGVVEEAPVTVTEEQVTMPVVEAEVASVVEEAPKKKAKK